MLDLILRGGRVIDPLNSIDGVMDVGFAAGRVSGIAARIDDQANEVRDVTGAIVAPGFIDLHTHVYWGGTSFPGIFAYSKAVMFGECSDIRLLDGAECVRVINENRDLIVGVKVRVGKIAGGSNGVAPLDMAIEAAAETGLPVMAHLDNPPPSRLDVLSRLRPGDVLTHCFKSGCRRIPLEDHKLQRFCFIMDL